MRNVRMRSVLVCSLAVLAAICSLTACHSDEGETQQPLNVLLVDPVTSPTTTDLVRLTGTTTRANARVRVEGGPAIVEVPSDAARKFVADVFLFADRANKLVLSELDFQARVANSVGIEIIHDASPPTLHIDGPEDGEIVFSDSVDVVGRVSDALSGFRGFSVRVNGREAVVNIGLGTNGTFEALGIPIAPTAGLIEVVAEDVVGNRTSRSVSVTQEFLTGSKIASVGGNGQTGRINQWLSIPIQARVLRADGAPYGGKLVTFEVTKSDGRLGTSPSGDGVRSLTVAADPVTGIASAFWLLGSDAGCGNNRVRVTSKDVGGRANFCASAAPGAPRQINVGSGNNQMGGIDSIAAEPLVAWVSDGCNPLEGVPVQFRIASGAGVLVAPGRTSSSTLQVSTDSTGHASVRFQFGAGTEPARVEATLSGIAGNPATFVMTSAPVANGPTTFEGIVLSNAYESLGGTVVSLLVGEGTILTTRTNGAGRFTLGPIPDVGVMAELFVEGSETTTLGGAPIDPALARFPDLQYQLVLVPGITNGLGRPVLLPQMDPINDVVYDGEEDVVLRVAGIDGLEVRVAAHSVTLADGSVPSTAAPIVLAMNQVHHDDIPMPIPDGAAPPFAWTLQPAGAHFAPPATIVYPNMAGLPPGAVAYFLSFDHDTASFEIVASGSVESSGARIVSDRDSGLIEAGWGGNCPPYVAVGDVEGCSETCVSEGSLSAGTVSATDSIVCLGETIEFTASGVVDSGGGREVQCDDGSGFSEAIPPGNIEFTFELITPSGTVVAGQGPQASIPAREIGSYTCTFHAAVTRACAPTPVDVGTASAVVSQEGAALPPFNPPDFEINVEEQDLLIVAWPAFSMKYGLAFEVAEACCAESAELGCTAMGGGTIAGTAPGFSRSIPVPVIGQVLKIPSLVCKAIQKVLARFGRLFKVDCDLGLIASFDRVTLNGNLAASYQDCEMPGWIFDGTTGTIEFENVALSGGGNIKIDFNKDGEFRPEDNEVIEISLIQGSFDYNGVVRGSGASILADLTSTSLMLGINVVIPLPFSIPGIGDQITIDPMFDLGKVDALDTELPLPPPDLDSPCPLGGQ